jgi:hypothetical protein
MRKIYDCFPFFNEFDLLELRLSECYDYVDFFVIAESNTTFTGNPKPYNLENWDKFKQFKDKIIYVKVDDMPNTNDPWIREYHQRNALVRGLTTADDNDVIVLSDCDEVLRPRTLNILRNDFNHRMWYLKHPMFYFKLNYLMVQPASNLYSTNPVALLKSDFSSKFNNNFQNLRNFNRSAPHDYETDTVLSIQHSAWHFTYLGDNKHLDTKLGSYSHTESQPLIGKLDIDTMIKQNINWDSGSSFVHVKIDNYFPKSVINNLDRWKDYIIQDATSTIRDYLPALDIEEIYSTQ